VGHIQPVAPKAPAASAFDDDEEDWDKCAPVKGEGNILVAFSSWDSNQYHLFLSVALFHHQKGAVFYIT
jgi:hypothetical protein